eukprot:augustus_masked-scaffold_12-processed-gene-5.9-mRNA-1 protein AED:1.00 eAED:1.00 QI:0/-1/0/0/-1/1/1/0/151
MIKQFAQLRIAGLSNKFFPAARLSTETSKNPYPAIVRYVYDVQPQLSALTGKTQSNRPDMLKDVWAYIKRNDLVQEGPDKKKFIKCDEVMYAVFQKPTIENKEVMGGIAKMVIKPHVRELSIEELALKYPEKKEKVKSEPLQPEPAAEWKQ